MVGCSVVFVTAGERKGSQAGTAFMTDGNIDFEKMAAMVSRVTAHCHC